MLKTKRCKGINGNTCNGKIQMDKTGMEGLVCRLAICHYGHTFSFIVPEKVKPYPCDRLSYGHSVFWVVRLRPKVFWHAYFDKPSSFIMSPIIW